jgi:copper homeostasis protein
MKYELEVIAFDLASCVIAAENGPIRIELCANPQEGGTTPSYGMIKEARKISTIQLFPIIRPRGGDFCYSTHEFNSMLHDIQQCRDLGCDGVVIGMLKKDGSIDIEKNKELVDAAKGMDVTFHRAFDRVNDPFLALEQIISIGCKRILTSGLKPNVIEGMETLKELVIKAGNRITIMPGSGVRSNNIIQLAEYTNAKSFHSSARKNKDSAMDFQNPNMRESLTHATIDADEVRALKNQLDIYFN